MRRTEEGSPVSGEGDEIVREEGVPIIGILRLTFIEAQIQVEGRNIFILLRIAITPPVSVSPCFRSCS
jgi:hypothetical protein